jgi:hypothetical protein
MRLTETRSRWLSPFAWLGRRPRQRPAWRLSFEQVEDRIAPIANALGIGPSILTANTTDAHDEPLLRNCPG